jgi:hypothetical protein
MASPPLSEQRISIATATVVGSYLAQHGRGRVGLRH